MLTSAIGYSGLTAESRYVVWASSSARALRFIFTPRRPPMGRVRRAKERLPCTVCGAPGYDPCISRSTGKPMSGFHCPRRTQGRHDVLNEQVRKLDGIDDNFWAWVWMKLGLKEGDYPLKMLPSDWDALYAECPEVDPRNQYHGTF